MNTLNIGTDFSVDPSGRFYSDGKGNGEDFRENYLLPKLRELKSGQRLVVVLDDGVESFGSSFLTEGFAGVVKYGYMENQQLLDCLEFKYDNPDFEFFKNKVIQYVKEARFNSKKYIPTNVD